jgi:hypothetical protein
VLRCGWIAAPDIECSWCARCALQVIETFAAKRITREKLEHYMNQYHLRVIIVTIGALD